MGMTRNSRLTHAAAWMLLIAVFGTNVVHAEVDPLPAPTPEPIGTESSVTTVQIVAGRSTIIDIGAPITRVSLTSPDIADALVTSSSQLLLHGKVPGTISMFVWNRPGGINRYEVAVQRDLTRLIEQMKQLMPEEPIDIRSNGKFVVLAGAVSSKDVIDRAVNVASGFVDKREDVVTLLRVQDARPSNQVLLRVRFAEVSRSALTEFGMSFFTSPTGVENTLGRVTTQQYSAPGYSDLKWSKSSSEFGSPVTSAEGKFTFSDFLNLFLLSEKYDIGLMIRALQSRGLFQSLAEPNLVAESGKEASFLAGGEFPIPVAQGSGANVAVTVQFKEFGVRLNFTPTVNGDRVHLRVRPEVSSLDFANGVVLNGFRIPALSTRRTETELELRDGQTFAIAGLLNNTMSSTMQKIPGIGDIPILGHLFRSRAAQKDQTELVVMITPQILRPDSAGVTSQLPRLYEPYLPSAPLNRTLPAPAPAFQAPAGGASITPSQTVAPVAAAAPAAPAASVALSRDRKKAIERAQAEEVAAQKRAAAEERRLREAGTKRQQAEAKRQQKLAAEQARRDAELAKRAAEAAKTQAAIEKTQKDAVVAAAARLKAAEEAYAAERARSSTR